MPDDRDEFLAANAAQIASQGLDAAVRRATDAWMLATYTHNYSYHFSWLGLPIIQYPTDIVATQELIWQIKPDLIIETGIARGGSLMLSASMLALLDLADARQSGLDMNPRAPKRLVVGIDVDIREHNRLAIEEHPLADRVVMISGSSVDPAVVGKVKEIASQYSRIMVMLDSNHSHDHVLEELKAYAPLVSPGGYCIVFDTIVEKLPDSLFAERPWGSGDSPMTAVREFVENHSDFYVDTAVDDKLLISVAPGGYLRRRNL